MFWWIIGIILLVLIIWVAMRPIPITGLVSHPNPVTSYEEARRQVKAMQDEDNRDLARDVCITKLFDHGSQTENVIVLFHGFTNCPEQFTELGKHFFQAGFNVFIPRTPHHGLGDRLTNDLVNLRSDDLCSFGDKVLDIAHGLGEKVTVMGISGGGNIATWLAQNRADLDFAFPIAPLFGLSFIPSRLTKFFIRLGSVIPNFYMWWDPRSKEENPHAAYYCYPGFPIRSLVEIFRLAVGTQSQAKRLAFSAGTVVMVINDDEPSVSNTEIINLLRTWREHGKGGIKEYHFEQSIKLPHDFITPSAFNTSTGNTYPRLIEAVKEITAH